ncbi:MAG: methyltransferase [Pseudomonadota bacterium]|nr:methyltransferase [Pseudomonadota bacterium]MEC7238207.1 methyltransferase [Pseudomonadota bacterium]
MTDDTTSDNDFRMMQVTHDHLLDEAVKITQPADGYRVGTDTVLLGAAISTASGRVLDLGAGVGGVSLCLAHRHHELQITAIEKHADLAALAQENAEVNGVANRLRILTTDIRELPSVLAGSFDHVVSNPPYHNSHGTRPRNADRALAHMGEDTDMVDWVKAAVWAAKPRAKITFICRADRVPELISLFEQNGAGEAVLFPLWPRHSSPAGRVILQVRRDVEGPGAVLPGLVLHRDDGGFTDAAAQIMSGGQLAVIHPARPLANGRRRAGDSGEGS